jgi:hypothetical protein
MWIVRYSAAGRNASHKVSLGKRPTSRKEERGAYHGARESECS